MWQILSVSAHFEQELWPHRNATLRRRSMQMLQQCVSSISMILLSR
uniref:Uncharacterized protein n=1 Tax=Anopheles christyi TaxID=43041 RepID=A0A182KIC7_9DIPT